MAADKQCSYRSQEHQCIDSTFPPKDTHECDLCLRGQIADSIELVASAIMERVMK